MPIWKINLVIMVSTFIASVVLTVLQSLVLGRLIKNMENGKGFSDNWAYVSNVIDVLLTINNEIVAVSLVMVIPIFILGLLFR